MSSEFLRDDLIRIVTPYIGQDNIENIKMLFDVALSKYQVSKKSTEIIPYNGDVNDEILKKFLCAKIARGCSKRTIQYYGTTLRKALQDIGKPYSSVAADDIRLYIALRVQRDKVTKTTANNERRCLSAFYGWLQKEEILLKNPMAKVEKIKVTREKKKAFTVMELEKIRSSCRNAREHAVIEMLSSTWCRVSELIGIKTIDIHDGKCAVHGKGDKIRDVYLNARAQLAVQKYLNERSDSNPYLFPGAVDGYIGQEHKGKSADWYKNPDLVSPDKPIDMGSIESLTRKLGRISGVSNVHPHRFRRTGATMALRAGMPLVQVSKLLGHESIETTQIYLDISEKELEEAHEKYVI
jgi:site-specific recombinase XerD